MPIKPESGATLDWHMILQAKGDEEFESGSQILTSIQQQRRQQMQQQQMLAQQHDEDEGVESDMPAEYQDDMTLGMNKTQARCSSMQCQPPQFSSSYGKQARHTYCQSPRLV